MATFGFYKDSAGTQALGVGELFRIKPGVDTPIYFLSTDATRKAEANSDPGVDPIIFSILDTTPGTDLADTNIKLALSAGALPGAPYGGTVSPGTVINGGVVNGVAIWIGNDSTEGAGVSVTCVELVEDAV